MKSRLLLLLLMTVISQYAFSNTLYFPQVAFGGGYSTTIVITNTGSTSVTSTLNFYDQNGGARLDLNRPITLAAGNSTRVTIPNTGSTTTAVWCEFAAGAGSVQGVATFELRDAGGTLQTIAGVLGVEAANSFIIPVDVTADGKGTTGVALANVSSNTSAIVRLRLIGQSGNQVGDDTTTFSSFDVHKQAADLVTKWFPFIGGTEFHGTMVVETQSGSANNSVVATALTVKEGILSALPVIPNTSIGTVGRSLYFPQVVYGGGYSTTFVVMNTGASTITSSLNFYDQSGSPRNDLTRPLSIPANGSVRVTLPNAGPTTSTVWGEFSPGAGTARGVASFDLRETTGRLITTAGVLGLETGNSFNLPVEVTADGKVLTGLAIGNSSASAFSVSMKLVGENGIVSGTPTSINFVARQQVADFVTKWFPTLAGTNFKGTLVLEAGSGAPTNALVATALTVKEGILSALAVNGGTIVSTTQSSGGGGGTGGTGGTGSGSASSCLNSSFFSQSNTVHAEYSLSGVLAGTEVADWIYTPNATFEGQSANEFALTFTFNFTGIPPQGGSSKSYLRLEGADIVSFGSITGITGGTVKSVAMPPYHDKRYTLAAGESSTVTYSLVTTTNIPGVPATPSTVAASYTVKFLGVEAVTVPAGTFNTCKFETTTVTSQTDKSTTWEIVGKGLTAKTVTVDSAGNVNITAQLTSGKINGTTVVP